LHEREQLRINDLFFDVNKPLTIGNTLEGRWISISWHRKVDPSGNIGVYAFDVELFPVSFRIKYKFPS
jgi:hypothetical protein